MNNKKIIIGLIIIVSIISGATGFIIGKNTNNSVSEDTKKNSNNIVVEESKKGVKDGSEFVGKWQEKDIELEHLKISQPSPSTFTIEKSYGDKYLVGEYKEGILIGEARLGKYTYILKDGILIEKDYDNNTIEYEKVDSFDY